MPVEAGDSADEPVEDLNRDGPGRNRFEWDLPSGFEPVSVPELTSAAGREPVVVVMA